MNRHDVLLAGCSPRPLAGYLKALGLHRVVAEQVDPDCSSWWTAEGFWLRSTRSSDELAAFLLDQYQPTPVVSPWNGGSGFFPKDNKRGIERMAGGSNVRFAAYADAIRVARAVHGRLVGADDDFDKATLLAALRAELPDNALAWLDAAVVLTSAGPQYPPLLGTGGNDGRLDFSNNFMQRLVELVDASPRVVIAWVAASLHGRPVPGLLDSAVGQFSPAQAGGYNTGFGFNSGSRSNPLDFVLMVEGALAFAAAAVRKLEGGVREDLAFPFMVRGVGAGYPSAAPADEAAGRDELWLPVWHANATWRELRQLLGEGRALVRGDGRTRNAVTGLDFARSLAAFGADRGIGAFERFGFHCRNGLAYLAVPLGSWEVPTRAWGDPLAPLDRWLARFRAAAMGDRAPARFRRISRELDEATFALCASDSVASRERVLRALGQAELALSRSPGFQQDKGLGPVPMLGGDWLPGDESDVTRRLALALAAGGLRLRFSRLEEAAYRRGRLAWTAERTPSAVWRGVSLDSDLAALATRIERERALDSNAAEEGAAGIDDVQCFIDGRVDERELACLALAYSLVRPAELTASAPSARGADPGYALLALCSAPRLWLPGREPDSVCLPRTPGLVRRALAGQGDAATVLASRRLRISGLQPRHGRYRDPAARDVGLRASPATSRRWGLALAFQLSRGSLVSLLRHFVYPNPDQESS